MLKTSTFARNIIKRYESFSPTPYRCPSGLWTIGWGHTNGVEAGSSSITEEVAERYLSEDLAFVESLIRRYVTVPLEQHQFDALVSITYNTGPGRPGKKDGIIWLKQLDPDGKPRHSTLLRMVNAGRFDEAAGEFGKWIRGGGVVLAGLVSRRDIEKKLFLGELDVHQN